MNQSDTECLAKHEGQLVHSVLPRTSGARPLNGRCIVLRALAHCNGSKVAGRLWARTAEGAWPLTIVHGTLLFDYGIGISD